MPLFDLLLPFKIFTFYTIIIFTFIHIYFISIIIGNILIFYFEFFGLLKYYDLLYYYYLCLYYNLLYILKGKLFFYLNKKNFDNIFYH
jgi:hypothetical protein